MWRPAGAIALTALLANPGPCSADREREREDMVATQVAARGVGGERGGAARGRVARHQLVPPTLAAPAHEV